jgi:hypothetical protein
MNLQSLLEILTNFCVCIPRELSSANLVEPIGDNLLQEEKQAVNQLQPFTYMYNSGFFWWYKPKTDLHQILDDFTLKSQKNATTLRLYQSISIILHLP